MKKILFVFALMIMIVVYAFMINNDLSENMVRFHVIANSDEAYDQELKLKVRNAVLAETAEVTAGVADKKEAVMAVNKHKSRIIGAAEQVIKDNGYNYKVRFEYGNYFFPEKKYDNLELPSGRYDAVRIKIGKAEGQNWWCVMFPPLCISEDSTAALDERAMEYLRQKLTPDEFELVKSGKSAPVVVRFRIVDAVMKLWEYVS